MVDLIKSADNDTKLKMIQKSVKHIEIIKEEHGDFISSLQLFSVGDSDESSDD